MLKNFEPLVQVFQSMLLFVDDDLESRSWMCFVYVLEEVDSSVAPFDSVVSALNLDLIPVDYDLSLDRN